MRYLPLTFLFILIFHLSEAQKPFSLLLLSNDSNGELLGKLIPNSLYQNDTEAKKSLSRIIPKLYEFGYSGASLDSVVSDSVAITAYIHLGKQYKWTRLDIGNVDEYVLGQIGFRDKLYNNRLFNQKQLTRLFNNLIVHYENNGYPFAAVKLDSLTILENGISGTLNLEKNNRITVDSISIKGTSKIASVYLYNYIGIKPGQYYSEKSISRISTRIKELPFLEEEKPFEVLFSDKFTKLTLFLKHKKASKFDGVLGVQPNENTGKVQFTGDVNLLLLNSLGRGESIDVRWRKLQNNVTDLKANMVYPFLFNTPFGAEGKFLLYKRDTSFQDIETMAGFQYILPGGNYIKVFGDKKQSKLLSTKGMENIAVLPEQIDVTNSTYGLGYKSEKLDYKYNPTSGYSFLAEGGTGTRRIFKNAGLPEEIYDSLKLKTIQFNGQANFNYFIPIRKQAAIMLGLKGAYRYSENLFRNELFRIGGMKTLRGFDVESIFASAYSIGTVEFRYLLEQNSYTYLFFDGAYYENRTGNNYTSDFPFGFGVGMTFETKAGIFSLNYALGYQQQQLAPLRSAKIHFGFINYF